MKFDELLRLFDGTEADLSNELLGEINRLVEIKVETEESELNEHIPMIKAFIESELEKQHEIADKVEDDRIKDFSELNDLYRKLVFGNNF